MRMYEITTSSHVEAEKNVWPLLQYFLAVFTFEAEPIGICYMYAMYVIVLLPRAPSPIYVPPSPLIPFGTHLVHHGNVVGFPDAHADAVRLERCLRVCSRAGTIVREETGRGRREGRWVDKTPTIVRAE